MKQGKRPNLRQKNLMQAAGLKYDDWLVERYTSLELVIVHRNTNQLKLIPRVL